jgi:hypothetical protein
MNGKQLVDAAVERAEEFQRLHGDEHPLDDALGDIHEAALWLVHQGMADTASRLARSHETIQKYLIESEDIPKMAQMIREAAQAMEAETGHGSRHDHDCARCEWLRNYHGTQEEKP